MSLPRGERDSPFPPYVLKHVRSEKVFSCPVRSYNSRPPCLEIYSGFVILGGFKFGLGSPRKCPGIEILDFNVLILAEADFGRFWHHYVDFDII